MHKNGDIWEARKKRGLETAQLPNRWEKEQNDLSGADQTDQIFG